jgi:hypothetical protein
VQEEHVVLAMLTERLFATRKNEGAPRQSSSVFWGGLKRLCLVLCIDWYLLGCKLKIPTMVEIVFVTFLSCPGVERTHHIPIPAGGPFGWKEVKTRSPETTAPHLPWLVLAPQTFRKPLYTCLHPSRCVVAFLEKFFP